MKYQILKKIDDYWLQYINGFFGIKLIFFHAPSGILHLSEFVWLAFIRYESFLTIFSF